MEKKESFEVQFAKISSSYFTSPIKEEGLQYNNYMEGKFNFAHAEK